MGDEGQDRWEKLVRSETLVHGVRVRPVPRRPQPQVRETGRDPSVFAENLRRLVRLAGLSDAEAHTQIGVGRRWLRGATTKGLARIDKRTRGHLERLARYFGLSGPDELWAADLPRLRRQSDVDQQVIAWRERVNWPYAKKLLELLESGEHDFLKGLIETLHASELLRAGGGAGATAVAAGPPPGHRSGLKRRIKRAGALD